MKLWVVVV